MAVYRILTKVSSQGDDATNVKSVRACCHRYNTYAFEGKKKVVLSTASWMGGANPFLGIAYFGVGGASLAFALAFLVLMWLSPRQAGDSSQLSWNKNK